MALIALAITVLVIVPLSAALVEDKKAQAHSFHKQSIREALHEAFGVANLSTLKQISAAIRNGHATTAAGEDVYLNAESLKLPIAFIHGEHNRLPVLTRDLF